MTVDLVVSVTQVSLLPGFFCFGIKHLVEMQTMSIDKDCFMHAWMAIQTGFKVNDVSAAWRGRFRTALDKFGATDKAAGFRASHISGLQGAACFGATNLTYLPYESFRKCAIVKHPFPSH